MKQNWTCPSCEHFVYGDEDFCGCGTLRPEYAADGEVNSNYVQPSIAARTPKSLIAASQNLGSTLVGVAWLIGVVGILVGALIGYQATFVSVDGSRFTVDSPILYFLASFLPVGFVSIVLACLLAFCGRTLQLLSGIYQGVHPVDSEFA